LLKHEDRYQSAVYNFDLPAFVRAFVVCHSLPAVETTTLEEAGMLPRLYASYKGRRCRITLLSAMGDVCISYTDRDHGYDERSIMWSELSNFAEEMHPGETPPKATMRQYAIADKRGFWRRYDEKTERLLPSEVPVLYPELAKARRITRMFDDLGIEGLQVKSLRVMQENA